MHKYITSFFFCGVAIVPAACAGNYQIGEVVISEKNGAPCFALNDSRSNSDIESITVYDSKKSPPRSVWKVLSSNGKKLSPTPNQCLEYGQVLNSWLINSDFSSNPEKLKTKTVYEAVIVTSSDGKGDSVQHYRGKFCLSSNASNTGSDQVLRVLWDARENRWNSDACRID